MPSEERITECPKPEITYFQNGRVEQVKTYYVVNHRDLAVSSYRRWGVRFFHDKFDEHHGVCGEDEIDFGNIPAVVRNIFTADTREGVRGLRERKEISDFIDKN